MLGVGWKPLCPNCRKVLAKNGYKYPPRLVFDQQNNYWLNASQLNICRSCEDFSKTCTDPSEKKKYTFSDISEEILEQISATHPEINKVFPCHLSFINAIDKKLMQVVVHSAVKGIGPSALSESIVSWHQPEWQKKKNLWASYVLKELNVPRLFQERMHRSKIQKRPECFSTCIGGCVPSGTWLINMFCSTFKKMRNYYDSESLKRAKSSKILAIDASYKVPKWMMKWDGDRIYDALYSGTKEYNEFILQRFSTSNNHEELGSNLKNSS